MISLLSRLCLFAVLSISWAQTAAETNALTSWYNSMTVSQRGSLFWNTGASYCTPAQMGIFCSGGRIIHLKLGSNGIDGTIPTQLQSLTELLELDLSYNSFTGSFPTFYGLLTKLQKIDLQGNQLSGSLPPQIGDMSALTDLYLTGNTFSSNIPTTVGKLANLRYFIVGSNQFNGPLPTEIGNLKNLLQLNTFYCSISGSIPTQIGSLTLLTHFYMGGNQLDGAIPTQIGNLKALISINLSFNLLTGSIPSEIGSIGNSLQEINFQNNKLIGTIPTTIGKVKNVNFLSISSNSISGTLPTELFLLTTIFQLEISNNQLSGTIPTLIGKFAGAFYFYLNNNYFTGNLPSQILVPSYSLLASSNHFFCPITVNYGTKPFNDYNTLLSQCSNSCPNPSGCTECSISGLNYNNGNCVDIDECLTNNGGCASLPSGKCTNTIGSRTCSCNSGYFGDGLTCSPSQCEADLGFPLTQSGQISTINNCPANQYGLSSRSCALGIWSPISTNCQSCPSGFSSPAGSPTISSCVDIDECASNNGGCSLNAKCTNTPGSRTCSCNSGYSGDGLTCSPSQCEADLGFPTTQSGQISTINNCPANQYGSSSRSCSFGIWSSIANNCQNCPLSSFSPANSIDISSCIDNDECASNNGGCSQFAKCTNTVGSRNCSCLPGFTGDGITCNDINECLSGNGNCVHGTCINTIGSRNCSCFQGFYYDGKRCIDINECLTNNGGCDSKANCRNTIGSRNCTCFRGYEGNGVTCSDINECLINAGGCPQTTICINTLGSRLCQCPSHTAKSGNLCVNRKTTFYSQYFPIIRFSLDNHTREDLVATTLVNIGTAQMVPVYQRNFPINHAVRMLGNDLITLPPITLQSNFTFEILINTVSYPTSSSDILVVLPDGKTQRSDATLIVSIDSMGRIVRESKGVVLDVSGKVVRLNVSQSLMVSYFSGKIITQFDGYKLKEINNFNNHIPDVSYDVTVGNNFDGYIDEIGAFNIALTVNLLHAFYFCKNSCPTGQVCINNLIGESCASRVF